jgi:hypothetical protein
VNPVNDSPTLKLTINNAEVTEVGAQYSDPISTVTATATDVDNKGSELTISVYGAALPADLLLTQQAGSTAVATHASPGVRTATIAGRLNVPMGDYLRTIKVVDTAMPTPGSASKNLNIKVSKETMEIQYTGLQFVSTSKIGGSVSPTLSAKVVEEQDGFLGTKAYSTIPLQLKFTVENASGTAMSSCTATVTNAGTASCTGSPAVKADNFIVKVELLVNGYYEAPTENFALTVTDPGTGFTTGGGWILDPNTTAKSNFGFTVKFLKSGGLQGNSIFIYRTSINLGALGVPGAANDIRAYNFIVKSNSMEGLAQKCTNPTTGAEPCWATFTGKSNVRAVDRTTGISYTLGADIIGNQQYFQVDVTDNGEPGSTDQYAIRVYTSAGTVYQVGTSRTTIDDHANQMVTLGGGNIQVRLKP